MNIEQNTVGTDVPKEHVYQRFLEVSLNELPCKELFVGYKIDFLSIFLYLFNSECKLQLLTKLSEN